MHTIPYFDRIAKNYDLLNKILSFGLDIFWRRKLVDIILKKNPPKILDLCAGTGDVAIALTKKNPRVEITAVDASSEMLNYAKKKISRLRKTNIKIIQANGLTLPFEKETFDHVTISFGLRNIGGHSEAIRESFRILKNNGQISILEFSYPKNFIVSAVYTIYLKYYLPFIGQMLSEKEAYSYLAKSIQDFSKKVQVPNLLREADFSRVSAISHSFGIVTIYVGEKN